MNNTFKAGIELGRKHYTEITKKGKRWLDRNVPAYIREQLLVPYYISELNDSQCLFVIQLPISPDEKVHFVEYARQAFDEYEATKTPSCKKQSCIR